MGINLTVVVFVVVVVNSATMVSAIMSLINDDFVDLNDLFRHLIPRSGVRFPCRK